MEIEAVGEVEDVELLTTIVSFQKVTWGWGQGQVLLLMTVLFLRMRISSLLVLQVHGEGEVELYKASQNLSLTQILDLQHTTHHQTFWSEKEQIKLSSHCLKIIFNMFLSLFCISFAIENEFWPFQIIVLSIFIFRCVSISRTRCVRDLSLLKNISILYYICKFEKYW